MGLRQKALLILFGMVLSAALAGGWVIEHLTTHWIEQTLIDEGTRLADALRTVAAKPLANENRMELRNIAKGFLYHQHVAAISFMDHAGAEVSFMYADPGARTLLSGRGEEEPVTVAYRRRVGTSRYVLARPVLSGPSDEAEVVGAVRMVLDSSEAAGRIRQVRITMLLVVLGIIVCFVPLGHLWIMKTFVEPVDRLARAADDLAAGKLDARAAETSRDEIGQLARRFNAMAEKIESQQTALMDANEHLEHQVRRRTADLDRANRQLTADLEEREQFMRAVGHDLNAPLRNIAGMATMILMKGRDDLPEEVVARLERIVANVETETEMISELLELSRIRSKPLRREWVDMSELLHRIAQSLEYDLRASNIELSIQPDMPTLYIEPSRFRQVFQNLLDNAVKYMDDNPQPRIEVTYSASDAEHIFSVSDNGPGIPAAEQEQVFRLFQRGQDSGRGVKGKGVGLASVRAIVARYGGRVELESKAGEGATFRVVLPVESTEPAARQEEATADLT